MEIENLFTVFNNWLNDLPAVVIGYKQESPSDSVSIKVTQSAILEGFVRIEPFNRHIKWVRKTFLLEISPGNHPAKLPTRVQISLSGTLMRRNWVILSP